MTVEALVQQYARKIKIKRDGWLCCCLYPSHRDSTPSMSIRHDGVFYCWGCGKAGNFATLLHDIAGVSWKRARTLSRTADECTPRPLLNLPNWERGIVEDTISRGLLGLYDVDWEAGYDLWRAKREDGDTECPPWTFPFEKGFDPIVLRQFEAGYDSTFQRVTIPVHNRRGQLVGFIGRTCIGDDQKYMVYPPLEASRYVYGIHRAVRGHGLVVLVEGPWDVWTLWKKAPEVTAVALMTSRVTNDQVYELLRARNSYAVLFDDDPAGRKGAYQVAHALNECGGRVDIVKSSREDMKAMTRRELKEALEERQPFPAMSALKLLRKA